MLLYEKYHNSFQSEIYLPHAVQVTKVLSMGHGTQNMEMFIILI